jgi:hypothetical protein
MPMLGDILATARRSASEAERRLGEAEPRLAERLRGAAAAEGITPAAYLRIAVAEFERFASEEDWAALTSRLRDSSAPGDACLSVMLEWRLARSVNAILAEGPVR